MNLFDAIQIRNKKESTETIYDFLNLLVEVERHDYKAAKYLLKLALSHTTEKKDLEFELTRTLDNCLQWDKTNQGREYWEELYSKIWEAKHE